MRSKCGVYFYCTAYCDAHFILSSSSICFSQQVTELEKGLTLISEEQGRVLFFSPRPPTNLLLVFSSVLCCPQDKRGDKQVRDLSGREEPRAENMSELLCVFFVNIHTNYIFFLCWLPGLGCRRRAPTGSLAGNDQVCRPFISVLICFLIYF